MNNVYCELLIRTSAIFLDITAWSRQPSICSSSHRYYPSSMRLYPAVLLLCKKAHREASSILYSGNRFEIRDSKLLTSFLDQIGAQNAGFLRHLVIAFPDFHSDDVAGIHLNEDGVRTLDLIRKKCQNIIILETSIRRTNVRDMRLDAFDAPGAVDQALVLVDAQLRAIPSLRELRVRVHNEAINPSLREKMRGYGWIIETMEESDGPFDGYDPYEDYNAYDAYDAHDHY